MVLNFGVFGGQPIYDGGGSMLVNQTSGTVAASIVWSVVTNGLTIVETGLNLYAADGSVTSKKTLTNTSASGDGWAFQGDIGRVVNARRLYVYWGSNLIVVAGRNGRGLLMCSVDGTNWTTLQTGTTHVAVTSYTFEYDGGDVRFRYLRVEWDNTFNGGAGSQASIDTIEVVVVLGED